MSSSAAKKDDDLLAEVVELSLSNSNDREQGLAQNFEDPVLEDLIPGLVQASEATAQPSVVQEAVEAVQELVNEAQGTQGTLDLSANFGDLQLTPDTDSHNVELGEFPAPAFDPDPALATDALSDLPDDSVEEPAQIFVMESGTANEHDAHSSAAMAEKLFHLVVTERSFDDLVEAGLMAIMQSLGAQAGAVLELDTEHQEYFFRSSIGGGDPEKVKSFRIPFSKGIVGHVGESRQPTLLRDLEADKMQMRAISMSVGFDAKTCMAAPILVAGQLYGVIEFFNRKDGALFEQRDLQLLESGTRMLSKVLEVRFLMAELMRRAR